MVDKNLKLLLPFHALRRSYGATAKDSLCLDSGGLTSPIHNLTLASKSKEPLSLLGDLLVLSTALLISISSEAVGIKLYGRCSVTKFPGCSMYMDIFDLPSRTAQALMMIMAALVVWIGELIHRTNSGIGVSPWCIAGLGALLSGQLANLLRMFHEDEPDGKITSTQIAKVFEGKVFVLRHYNEPHRQERYGIIPLESKETTVSRMDNNKMESSRLGLRHRRSN
jgi:hypothetical protein